MTTRAKYKILLLIGVIIILGLIIKPWVKNNRQIRDTKLCNELDSSILARLRIEINPEHELLYYIKGKPSEALTYTVIPDPLDSTVDSRYDSSGELWLIESKKYNTENQIVAKYIHYTQSGKIDSSIFERNEKRNIIQEYFAGSSIKYEYNEDGNLIRSQNFKTGSASTFLCSTNQDSSFSISKQGRAYIEVERYDDKGRIIYDAFYPLEDYGIHDYKEFFYDKDGHI